MWITVLLKNFDGRAYFFQTWQRPGLQDDTPFTLLNIYIRNELERREVINELSILVLALFQSMPQMKN